MIDKGRLINKMINLTLPERIYYGKDDANKEAFVELYKDIKLKWSEHVILDGKEVSGWFNSDKTEYIIKLQEIKGYKRLSIVGCQEIVDFFKGLGAKEFEIFRDDVKERPSVETIPKMEVQQIDVRHFIGADLDSHYRFEERLREMPDNWGVRWK